MKAKVATAGVASEEQSEKLAELAKERDAIQLLLDNATSQVRAKERERERARARDRGRGRGQVGSVTPLRSFLGIQSCVG